MKVQPREAKKRSVAYRCHECADTVWGLVGNFTRNAGLIRLKCSCDKPTAMDISAAEGKIKLSVPCLFCKQNHTYTVSESAFLERELLTLSCPYTGLDILFVGSDDAIDGELRRTADEITRLMASLEAEEISDIQPKEMTEEEILPDPAVYDTLRFIVKDLEADGQVICPCGEGPYDLRFADGGIEVYCEKCGASYLFRATTPTMAEEYLSVDKVELK